MKLTYKQTEKFDGMFCLIDYAIAYELVDMIDVYSDKKLSDDIKEKIFNEALNMVKNCDLQGVYDEINDLKVDLREDIADIIGVNQVEDLKDSYINN